MEVKGSSERSHLVFAYEAIGTMMFIYAILLTNNPLSIGCSLFASIVLFGSITGGHFNPAVTLAVYISEAKWMENLSWLFLVITAQICGAFMAQGLAEITLFQDKIGTINADNVAKLCPQDPTNADWPTTSVCDGYLDAEEGFHSDYQVLLNETILTAVFISVILMVKGLRTSPSSDGVAGALAICFTLIACIQTGGKLGGCFNPAVGLSVTTFSLYHLEDVNNSLVHYLYAFILGPLLGGAVAGGFSLMHRKNFESGKGGDASAETIDNSATQKTD